MKIAVFCVAVLALLQALLGCVVSFFRRKYRISAGCPDDPAHPLYRLRTAFSNCAEWHPILIALMLLSGMYASQKWSIWLYPAVVAGRCFHVLGLVAHPLHRPNATRVVGATLTYLLTIGLSLLVINDVFLAV
ncbi:MAG TPA: MAPEG family protein [Phycisphaerales bacterium]|nr:MAPEG family protein [Phycisphaerales bacterium]